MNRSIRPRILSLIAIMTFGPAISLCGLCDLAQEWRHSLGATRYL
jgi:hypothetical protein